MADTVRAVEIGSILPRATETRRSLPARRTILLAAGLVIFAGIIILSPLVEAILESLVGPGASATGQPSAELESLVTLVKAIVALALVAAAAALITRSVDRTESSGPLTPEHVDLRSLSRPDVTEASAHLAGHHETCDTPRGMAAGEIVVARITENSADRLAEIPDECQRRRRASGLFPILVGVPNAPRDVVEEVGDAFQTTLLVDPGVTDRIPRLLGLLAHLCGSAHRENAVGIGGPSLKCIRIDGYGPNDPDLKDELREGRGEPLASEVDEARETDQGSAVTIISAPPDYLETALEALPPHDGPLVSVRTPEYEKIHIARLFVTAEPSDRDTQWIVRQAVIRDGSNKIAP